ncbi:MAG: Arginine/ornithine antiporter ArcD, partial [uncultured Nocardioidaceae bacterium]
APPPPPPHRPGPGPRPGGPPHPPRRRRDRRPGRRRRPGPADRRRAVELLARVPAGHPRRPPSRGRAAPARRADADRRPVRRRSLDLPVGGTGFRRHRGGPLVVGHHAARLRGPGRGAGPDRAHDLELGHPGQLGPRRRAARPHQPRQPARRPRPDCLRHLDRGLEHRRQRVAAAGDAAAAYRHRGHTDPRRRGRGGVPAPGGVVGDDVRARRRAEPRTRPGPRRPPVQPDDPPGRVPAVRRRRRGLVLPDVDRDGARLVRRAAAALGVHVGRRRLPRPGRRPRGADDLRPAPRRDRQLVVRHRLRRQPHRPRVRHPAAPPARGRAVHRRRHPPRRLDHLRRGRAPRGADLLDQRAPARGGRLPRERRRRGQRPGGRDAARGPAHLRPRPVRGRVAQALLHRWFAARLRRPRVRRARPRPPAAGPGGQPQLV